MIGAVPNWETAPSPQVHSVPSNCRENKPTDESYLAVGRCMLGAFQTKEYIETRDPMICWRAVSKLQCLYGY